MARLRRERYYQRHSHFCVNCDKRIHKYNGHGQKYCKTCSFNIKLEQVRLLRLAYYRKWKNVLIPDLGSGWLSHNPTEDSGDDFREEFLRVRRELKRLRLKY